LPPRKRYLLRELPIDGWSEVFMAETRPSSKPGKSGWWQRCAGLMAIVLVFGLLVEGLTAGDVSAKRGTGDLPAQAEIINGFKAGVRDFPFMALVLVGNSLCGGTLIDADSVLTAAHCVTAPNGGVRPPSAFELYIGKANLNRVKKSNRYRVVSVYRYDKYDPGTFQNDVAVLKLNRPVSGVSPIPIVAPDSDAYQAPGQGVLAAGWGTTSVNKIKISLHLRAVQLAVVSNTSCEASYPDGFDVQTMMCASAPGKDSCRGDSGGPLLGRVQTGTTPVVIKKKRKGKKPRKKQIQAAVYSNTQVGVVSWGGFRCADPAQPGVYVRLSEPGINAFVTESAAK
jgi:trypsin